MGRIDILIDSATGLPDLEVFGIPDPYVKCYVDGKKEKTSVCRENLNPVWKEWLSFNVPKPTSATTVSIEVWNKNPIKNDFMGQYKTTLSGLSAGEPVEKTVHLQKCKLPTAKLTFRLLARDDSFKAPPEATVAEKEAAAEQEELKTPIEVNRPRTHSYSDAPPVDQRQPVPVHSFQPPSHAPVYSAAHVRYPNVPNQHTYGGGFHQRASESTHGYPPPGPQPPGQYHFPAPYQGGYAQQPPAPRGHPKHPPPQYPTKWSHHQPQW